MLLLLQIQILQIQQLIYQSSKNILNLERNNHHNNINSFVYFSIISRDCQTANIGTAQTIMLTNSPNSIILTGQQQTQSQQTINRNLIEQQEPIIYTTTTAAAAAAAAAATAANTGRNELFFDPINAKQTRLWQ